MKHHRKQFEVLKQSHDLKGLMSYSLVKINLPTPTWVEISDLENEEILNRTEVSDILKSVKSVTDALSVKHSDLEFEHKFVIQKGCVEVLSIINGPFMPLLGEKILLQLKEAKENSELTALEARELFRNMEKKAKKIIRKFSNATQFIKELTVEAIEESSDQKTSFNRGEGYAEARSGGLSQWLNFNEALNNAKDSLSISPSHRISALKRAITYSKDLMELGVTPIDREAVYYCLEIRTRGRILVEKEIETEFSDDEITKYNSLIKDLIEVRESVKKFINPVESF